jgi:hypothetical protein
VNHHASFSKAEKLAERYPSQQSTFAHG